MGDMFSIDISQVELTRKQFDQFKVNMAKGIKEITRQYADVLKDRVVHNASGAPGPEIVTGEYVNSIHVEEGSQSSFGTGLGYGDATVSTNSPYAARLEYGFVGADSLGRIYDQPPFPHWQPAVDVTEPEYLQALQNAVPVWWNDAAKK